MHGVDTGRRPFVLVWELTQACSLSCDHCRAEAQPDRHPDELTTAEGKRLLDNARAFGDGQLVVFSGGDPAKRDDLLELIEYGTEIGLTVTLTPSGTEALSAEMVRRLADSGLKRMALSLDGASADTHDDFRGESGSFDQTLAAARAARDAELPLQINTTVCQRTVDDLPELRTLVSGLDAALWSVFFLVPVGRGRVLEPIDPARADEVMDWLAGVEDEIQFAVKTTEAPQYRRIRAQREGSDPDRSGIIAGDGFAFVSHTGEVYPSGFLPESAGNVREESVVSLYRDSPLFESLRDRDQLQGKCGACPYRAICGGSRSRAYAYTGDPLASDPLCPYVPPDYEGSAPTRELP
jgi:radical SAM protein with 4Fe4S-binding SPASM domain